MKLVNFNYRDNSDASTRIGLIHEKKIFDLIGAYANLILGKEALYFGRILADLYSPSDVISFFRSGRRGIEAINDRLKIIDVKKGNFSEASSKILFEMKEVKLLAPVTRPNTIRDFSTFEEHQ